MTELEIAFDASLLSWCFKTNWCLNALFKFLSEANLREEKHKLSFCLAKYELYFLTRIQPTAEFVEIGARK